MSSSKSLPGFRARLVDPKTNFDILSRWMDICRTVHIFRYRDLVRSYSAPAEEGDYEVINDSGPAWEGCFWVIDYHTRRVVTASPQCEYIALSYVWGPPNLDESASTIHTSGEALPNTLPSTIEDAIAVVGQLGFRYLWVDRYCINQNDPVDKHNQIKNMDQVYKYAQATILAGADSDPTYRLPRVSRKLRLPQPRARVLDHLLVSTLPDPQELVRSSMWKTRAWTYQEAVFSRRRIYFFTDQQVYIECDTMRCYEAV
jgi:hypothetical protein